MRHYDPRRYRIAPWRGRYGDQAHRMRLHPHRDRIKEAIEEKKREMLRLDEQIRQLKELKRRSSGTIVDGVLVYEGDLDCDWYSISLATDYDKRWAQIYPNAHNKGKTFGLQIHWAGHPFGKDENRGWGHSREQAIEGARAWVLRHERQPRRYDRKDGTILEEP